MEAIDDNDDVSAHQTSVDDASVGIMCDVPSLSSQ